jgi:hypothetical protein
MSSHPPRRSLDLVLTSAGEVEREPSSRSSRGRTIVIVLSLVLVALLVVAVIVAWRLRFLRGF